MTSTNDEREALRDFADRMQEAAANCCIDPDAGPDAQTSISFTGEEGAKLAHALHSAIASLPAPASAAGEAVAWQRLHPQRGWLDCDPDDVSHYRAQGQEVRPLYAAPQATATGGELTAWAYVHPETGERDFSWDRDSARAKRCRQCGWTEIALANHSPDAGGVGEAVPGSYRRKVTPLVLEPKFKQSYHPPQPDEEANHYLVETREMFAALNPADAEGGE